VAARAGVRLRGTRRAYARRLGLAPFGRSPAARGESPSAWHRRARSPTCQVTQSRAPHGWVFSEDTAHFAQRPRAGL